MGAIPCSSWDPEFRKSGMTEAGSDASGLFGFRVTDYRWIASQRRMIVLA